MAAFWKICSTNWSKILSSTARGYQNAFFFYSDKQIEAIFKTNSDIHGYRSFFASQTFVSKSNGNGAEMRVSAAALGSWSKHTQLTNLWKNFQYLCRESPRFFLKKLKRRFLHIFYICKGLRLYSPGMGHRSNFFL